MPNDMSRRPAAPVSSNSVLGSLRVKKAQAVLAVQGGSRGHRIRCIPPGPSGVSTVDPFSTQGLKKPAHTQAAAVTSFVPPRPLTLDTIPLLTIRLGYKVLIDPEQYTRVATLLFYKSIAWLISKEKITIRQSTVWDDVSRHQVYYEACCYYLAVADMEHYERPRAVDSNESIKKRQSSSTQHKAKDNNKKRRPSSIETHNDEHQSEEHDSDVIHIQDIVHLLKLNIGTFSSILQTLQDHTTILSQIQKTDGKQTPESGIFRSILERITPAEILLSLNIPFSTPKESHSTTSITLDSARASQDDPTTHTLFQQWKKECIKSAIQESRMILSQEQGFELRYISEKEALQHAADRVAACYKSYE